MKKAFFLLSIFTSVLSSTMSQSIESPFDSLDVARLQVMYDLTFREDSTHLNHVGKQRMVLFIGNTISSFEGYGNYQLDRIRYQKMSEGGYFDWFSTNASGFVGRFMYQIYKNFPFGKMTYTDMLLIEGRFKYYEDMDEFDWIILDDTLSIAGYLCQKAVCQYGGRSWEAWFTDELPFSDGPYKFNGLPGLIMQVADTRNHYCFSFVSIEKPAISTNIEWHDVSFYGSGFNYIPTTRKDFLRVEDELRGNIMSHFDERISAAEQKQVYKVMQSRNNPIELDRK
ncbi:MAG: GLPGLI family protein [bacterium]|nr:MAG: hypothetical protein F082_1491 [bacterium F082]MDO5315946.1 GLPGLI family protein [bacterium]